MERTELSDGCGIWGTLSALCWQSEGCSLSWEDGEDREKAAEEWLWHSNVVFGDWETTGYSSHSWGPAPGPGSDLGSWQMLLNTLSP